ncbi:MAG: GHKL domain-containing protein [Turicibacter sp.]|nr:GHKL domain-containing protein [Turicibacter sp.]
MSQVKLGIKGIFVIMFGLIGYIILFIAILGNENVDADILILLTFISGIVTVVATAVFVLLNNKIRESKQREELQAQNYALQQKHYTALYEKEERTKKFRHDIDKQLIACRELLNQNETEELAKYLDSILKRKKSIDEHAGIKTGSDFVDANLNALLAKAEYANINFNRNWTIPNNLMIEAMDMTSLFMNLLTNAFEATVQCVSEPFVHIKIKAHHDSLYLSVKNNYNGVLKVENEKFKTTKKDEEGHGYGFQIISDVVDKYNGRIEVASEGEEFVVEITFGKDIYVKENEPKVLP